MKITWLLLLRLILFWSVEEFPTTDRPNCVTLSTVMHGRVFYEFCQLLVDKKYQVISAFM